MKKELRRKNSRMMMTISLKSQGWRRVRQSVFWWSGARLIWFYLVYNEDLEEDNSDWNEVGEDEEEDDIDSDGKRLDPRVNGSNL